MSPARRSHHHHAEAPDLPTLAVAGWCRPCLGARRYENDVIRPLGEERVHFALNRMVVSCPRLPRAPFTAAGLGLEPGAAERLFFPEPRNLVVDGARRVMRVSAILDFYTEDFLARAPTLVAYVNRTRTPPVPADHRAEFLDYDWTINKQPGGRRA